MVYCRLASVWASAMRVHRRLKRSRSASMARKRGRSRLLRWANTLSRLQPLQPGCWHLHRERHFGRGAGHGQAIKQAQQLWVGGVVEHQEAGVHAVADAVDRHVHRVGMAAEVAVGLEQHQLGIGRQLPGGGQPGDARARHGHAMAAAGAHDGTGPAAAGREKKSAVQRPETNEGGREEEEMGLRISFRKSERLHGFKIWACPGREIQRPQQPPGLDFDQRWLILSRGA